LKLGRNHPTSDRLFFENKKSPAASKHSWRLFHRLLAQPLFQGQRIRIRQAGLLTSGSWHSRHLPRNIPQWFCSQHPSKAGFCAGPVCSPVTVAGPRGNFTRFPILPGL